MPGFGLEPVDHVVIDFAFIAIGIAHEADFLRRCGASQKRKAGCYRRGGGEIEFRHGRSSLN
jgi:hypothetical protein